MDLSINYLGLSLKNPLIAGASELTSNMESIKAIEKAGAGALVIKSLFEEQIQLERLVNDEKSYQYRDLEPEMARNFFEGIQQDKPAEHLYWTRKAKEAVSIPVIASLNCVNRESWTEYAQALEETGVDALELNFYTVPTDFDNDAKSIEDDQVKILKSVKNAVSIPVSVKLTPAYTNILSMVEKLDTREARGYVLFNRLFEPDIDVDKEEHITPLYLSSGDIHRQALRYTGLLYGYTEADLCASGGIYTGKDMAKMILAGASCVQVVSALYKNKIGHITTMLEELEAWMESKNYHQIGDFMGKLSRKNIPDPWLYKRSQYVRMLMKGNPLER